MGQLFDRIQKTCQHCKTPITDDLLAYGRLGDEICWDCYWDLIDDDPMNDWWYGMAPHVHDLSKTGGIIGSTVFMDYADCPTDGKGRYWIESTNAWFSPDDEVDGAQGIWDRGKPPPPQE